MTMNWTDEQLAIFDFVTSSKYNLQIEALAGAAKTTTLVGLAPSLSGSVLSVAFNKRIADEMGKKMPPGTDCRTLNALGHRIWAQHLSRRLNLSAGKLHHLLLEAIEDYAGEDKDFLYKSMGDLHQLLRTSKNAGHVPDASVTKWGRKIVPILTDEAFFASLPEDYPPLIRTVALSVLSTSFDKAMTGTIDFADQLLLPTVTKCVFPVYENILVDEAQDLSELNHTMIAKLAKRRLITVGDPYQAIYAFRGASSSSMPELTARFSMTSRSLTTTFRCPEAICEHVRWHVPHINSWPGNPNSPGSVTYLSSWSPRDIPEGAAVLCRNNAPLFSLAIAFLRAGRRPQVWGRDIAASLIKVLENLGAKTMSQRDALLSLDTYYGDKLKRVKRHSAAAALDDQIACLRIFIEDAETLGGAVAFARAVLESEGKIDLCTGHKSKGHEWNDVFILDRSLLSDEEQDKNLSYVMATRSLRNLTYINSNDRML